MTWEHFCDKAAYEWSDSTTLGMISKIDSLGTAEQIIEMVEYHLDDDSSKRLLNRAIKDKVLFSPDQATYVVEEYMEEKQANRLIQSMLDDGIKFPADIIVSRLRHEVSEAVLNRLVKEGADDVFSEEEIEELEGIVDDDVLRSAVAGVMNSDDIGTEIQNHLDEYLSEEDMRRSLDRFLDAAGMTLTAQQVCDMAQDMYEDVADVLVRDVVDRGMKFTTDQVMQLIDIVTQPVMEHLVSHTEGPFSEAELERLDGKINDLLLANVTGLSDGELELADEMIDEVRHSETDERKERILKRAMDAYVYFSWDQACDMAVLFNQENADKLIRHKVEYVEEWDYCTNKDGRKREPCVSRGDRCSTDRFDLNDSAIVNNNGFMHKRV